MKSPLRSPCRSLYIPILNKCSHVFRFFFCVFFFFRWPFSDPFAILRHGWGCNLEGVDFAAADAGLAGPGGWRKSESPQLRMVVEIPWFISFQHLATIRLVEDFATIHSMISKWAISLWQLRWQRFFGPFVAVQSWFIHFFDNLVVVSGKFHIKTRMWEAGAS